jgi:hypothetical protein
LDNGKGGKFGRVVSEPREKISFCLRDDYKLSGRSFGYNREGFFSVCGGNHQGISPGWVDYYGYTLAGQWVDVGYVPNGLYYLSSEANPFGVLVEKNYE